ncbi:MAG: SLC13 family permease [Chloroflexota bacterium]
MNVPQLYLLVVLVVPLSLAVTNRLRVDVAALSIALALGILQFLGVGILGAPDTPGDAVKAISGLSQPVVVTLFSLFIVTRCLDKTGVTRWIARRVLAIGGKSESRLILLFSAATALLSLFMNNLAAGALLLPSAMDVARHTKINPSKLLIPVAYGSLLGGVATYFTTANIIASDLLTTANPPQAPLHILDFTPTGGLIALAGLAFLAIFGERLLPDRPPRPEQLIARRTGSELEEAYQIDERLWELRVLRRSPIVGKSLLETGIGEKLGLAIVAIWHGRQAIFAPPPDQIVRAGDILLVVGREERVTLLAQQGMRVGRDDGNGHASERGASFIEVVLSPRSKAEGRTLKELEFRKKFGFTAVALLRSGRSYRTDVADFKLSPGDSLLVVGSRQRLRMLQSNADFVVLESDLSDQPVNQRQALLAVGVIVAAITASVLGVPVYLAMLAAALVVVISGLISMEEAYHSMEWQAIFLIAGMYSVSLAMVRTGLASQIGDGVVNLVTPFGPLGLAAGIYVLTSLLTQVMGGQVTILVTGPIAISAALSLHTNPQAMVVAAAIGCSASFATPIAHPVNIMMIGPGNYTFGDFFRAGWALTLVCFVALLIGMVLFWKL